MIRKKVQGLEWLEFEQLQEFSKIKHAFFLRHGGVSSGAFQSLNAGGNTGDDPASVEENRRRMLLFFPKGKLISSHQVHGIQIEQVQGSWEFQGTCDGLITQEPYQALMVKSADCQTALFYDPVQHRLAQVHCGWRGNVQNIYAQTVRMFQKLGSHPANLFVCISPSLGPKRSEFIHHELEFPPSFQEFQWKDKYFNLWEISGMQLREAGVLPTHIECAELCTYEGKDDYFSYRRDQQVTGRHAFIAMLH